MAWVPYSDQTAIAATLQASGNPFDPTHSVQFRDSIVAPDGQYARVETWELSFTPPARVAIETIADHVPTPPEASISGGFQVGVNSIPYLDEMGTVVLQNGAGGSWGPPIESVDQVDRISYSPPFNYDGTGQLPPGYNCRVLVWQGDVSQSDYNCDCDDGQPKVSLSDMRFRLARRLGYAVQVNMLALPPGMPELLDDFIRSAHDFLYQRYSVMRLRRMFTWDMLQGVRFYDLDGNMDACPRVLDADKLEWVGISQGDLSWRPLICGINPVLYGSTSYGIPSHYEIRQCIEVWPPPSDDTWQLRIKGDFGPSPLEADDDVLTVDPEAVFLQALANAKAHYGQADAGNYASQAQAYIRSRVAGSHQTRRYIPGSTVQPPAVRPLLKED